jgi:hypothetical protein
MAMPTAAVPAMPTAQAVMAVPAAEPFAAFAVGAAPVAVPAGAPAAAPVVTPRRPRERQPEWIHLIPAGALLLVLLLVVGRDLFFVGKKAPGEDSDVDPTPRIKVRFDYIKDALSKSTMRFGVTMPNSSKKKQAKKLTFDVTGRTNSTVLRIDDKDLLVGASPPRFDLVTGKWLGPPKEVGRYGGRSVTWKFKDVPIEVTQTVEPVPGEPQVINGEFKRLLDTCLVRYTIVNNDSEPHRVGLRFLLDTYIGENDGVPFTIPGKEGLVDTDAKLEDTDVPGFIMALEKPDLNDPGTVAQLTLRVGGNLEPPEKVLLTHWPDFTGLPVYVVPQEPMINDSAVALYWEEKELAPGARREVGFSYGLGAATTESGKLAISVGGAFEKGGELSVVGLLAGAKEDDKLKIELPDGLKLISGDREQTVPTTGVGGRPTPVTWKVRADQTGDFEIRVTASTGVTETRRIRIKEKVIFE